MDMTPEMQAVMTIIGGILMIGVGFWYFLPERTQRVLGALWAFIRAIWTRK